MKEHYYISQMKLQTAVSLQRSCTLNIKTQFPSRSARQNMFHIYKYKTCHIITQTPAAVNRKKSYIYQDIGTFLVVFCGDRTSFKLKRAFKPRPDREHSAVTTRN